jgi:hypothetical protein
MIKAVILAAALLTGIGVLAQQFDMDTILFNGNPDAHINLVILGDGYTYSELPKFVEDASIFTTTYFNEIPFLNYSRYFNVFLIKVPSNESGASHPGTATDVAEPAHPVIAVDNYFGSTFDYANMHRLLVATKTSVISNVLADNFPDYDQVFILVNSPYYGGSGGYYTVASTHPESCELAAHELGHSFSGLMDEYWAGEAYAAEGINMTKQTDPSLVRWKNWIGTNLIGIYRHCCGGTSAQWYKPHENCKMQFLGTPFCSVCVQGTVERIHALVTPVESYYPQNAPISADTVPVKFKLSLIAPEPNTLKRIWMLNGIFLKQNIDSVIISKSSFLSGTNTLKATIEDTSQFLRVDDHASIHISTITWSINGYITDIKVITSSSFETTIDLYPNPTSDYLNIKWKDKKGDLRFEIYDMHGQMLLSQMNANSINLQNLNQGTFIIKIYMDNDLVTTRKIIKE